MGEVRCGKKKGLEIKQWLQSSGSGIAHRPLHGVDVKVYPDTKIRLHFATFKLLPEERDTCFWTLRTSALALRARWTRTSDSCSGRLVLLLLPRRSCRLVGYNLLI